MPEVGEPDEPMTAMPEEIDQRLELNQIQVLAKLTPLQQAVLRLIGEGYTPKAIAQRYGKSTASVYKAYRQARAKLRQCVSTIRVVSRHRELIAAAK
jgi:DNA-directed RNA polymerase specialized sigma24 family protein